MTSGSSIGRHLAPPPSIFHFPTAPLLWLRLADACLEPVGIADDRRSTACLQPVEMAGPRSPCVNPRHTVNLVNFPLGEILRLARTRARVSANFANFRGPRARPR